MIFLILVVLALIAMVMFWEVSDGGSGMFILLVALLCIPLVTGITSFPNLVAQQEKALSLKSEIETMRSAYYPQSGTGSLVGGSLDNMQQSKALSNYVSNYATAKSEYNQSLQSAKARLNMPFYWWLGDTIFMSKEILKMERIK